MNSKVERYAIGVKGGYGLTNFGDDALLVALYPRLRRIVDKKEMVLFCPAARYIQKQVGDVVAIASARHVVHCETLIYGGGTQFYDFSITHSGSLAAMRRFVHRASNPRTLVGRIRSRLSPVQDFTKAMPDEFQKVVALGVGLGPFEGDSNRLRVAQEMVACAAFVSVRDGVSLRYCREWGREEIHEGADLCFLPGAFQIPAASSRSSPESIGIIVRDWIYSRSTRGLLKQMRIATEKLRNLGFRVIFVVFAKERDKDWLATLKAWGERACVWDPHSQSIDQFLQVLNQFDILVSSRYHGAVFGAILGKPVVTISLEPKLATVGELLNEGGLAWDEPFDAGDLVSQIDTLTTEFRHRQCVLKSLSEMEGARALEMVELALEKLSHQ